MVSRYAPRVALAVADDLGVVVEIGCGKGDATAAMAVDDRALVIACEPNQATCAHLAHLLTEAGIGNVRIWIGDVFELCKELPPGTVDEIRAWFPDPWPKPRHGHKRLVHPTRLHTLATMLRLGGRFRLATDDPCYAAETMAACAAEPLLRANIVERPARRPITVFEARGLREGRVAVDIEAIRVSSTG